MPTATTYRALILVAILACLACGEARKPGNSADSPEATITGRPPVIVGIDRDFPPYTTGVLTEAHLRDRPTLVWQPDGFEEYLLASQIAAEILPEAEVAETMRRLATWATPVWSSRSSRPTAKVGLGCATSKVPADARPSSVSRCCSI